jgi:hypothetical protein
MCRGRGNVSKPRPRYVRTLRPPARRLRCFGGRYELGGDGGGEFERAAGLVVGDGDVEGVEEVGELNGRRVRKLGSIGIPILGPLALRREHPPHDDGGARLERRGKHSPEAPWMRSMAATAASRVATDAPGRADSSSSGGVESLERPGVSLGTESRGGGVGRLATAAARLVRGKGRSGAVVGTTAATGSAGIALHSSKIPLQIGYDRGGN